MISKNFLKKKKFIVVLIFFHNLYSCQSCFSSNDESFTVMSYIGFAVIKYSYKIHSLNDNDMLEFYRRIA